MGAGAFAASSEPRYRKLTLATEFFCEGVSAGDVNRDGRLDVIAGPFWFEGPDFKTRHEIYAAVAFPPLKYSDNFLVFVGDLNTDGWADVLVVGPAGKDLSWYENPRGAKGHWRRHVVFKPVGNESPRFVTGGDSRVLEFFCASDNRLGRAYPAGSDTAAPWVFTALSAPGDYGIYMHGLGVGDVNGDRRADLLERSGWWERPAKDTADALWTKHDVVFSRGPGGAQMFAVDVNGDGMPDVVSGHDAHGYGLSWFEQRRAGNLGRAPAWQEHPILSTRAEEKIGGVQFSQLHAIEVGDLDRDGRVDIVTGKRWWAHGPAKDPDAGGASVVYAFLQRRAADGTVHFEPRLVDDNSGVGTQIALADVNGDQRLDILTANKRGIFVFLAQ